MPLDFAGNELQAPQPSAPLRVWLAGRVLSRGLAGEHHAPEPAPLQQLPLGWRSQFLPAELSDCVTLGSVRLLLAWAQGSAMAGRVERVGEQGV